MTDPARARREVPVRFVLLGVFLLALAVRVVYVLAYRSSPWFDHPLVDAEWHDRWAREWAAGTWSLDGRPFFRAPLYPWFLSLLYRVAGPDYLAVRLVQAAIGASGAAAIAGTGTRLFGARAGICAGVAAAAYGTLVFFDGELLIPNLLVALLAWSAFVLAGRPALVNEAVAAGFLGLAVTARPNALSLFPLLLCVVGWRRRAALRAPATIGRLALVGTIALAPALGVTWINWRETGTFVFISSQGGVNFYAGNHAGASGRTVQIPGLDNVMSWEEWLERSESIPAREAGRPLSPAETSRWWSDRAWRWIREHPIDAAGLTARKLYYLLNAFEIPNNRDAYLFQAWPLRPLLWKIPLLAFPWGLVFPLAAAGFVIALRDPRARAPAGLLGAWFVLYGFSLLPFFIFDRLRLAMVPPLAILAGVALGSIPALRSRGPLFAAAAAFFVANSAFFGVRIQNPADEKTKYAATLLDAGQFELGIALLEEAAAAEPGRVAPAYLLADAYLERGNFPRSRALFERVVRLRPADARARFSLGAVLLELGEWEQAAIELEAAVKLAPGDAAAWVNLGVANVELGDTARAEAAYREGLAAAPAEIGYIRLADIYLARGNLDEAVHVLDEGVSRLRTSFALRYRLALALARWGRYERAMEEIDVALGLNRDDPAARELQRRLTAVLRERR